MRSLLLLCALAGSLILVCKPSKRHHEARIDPVGREAALVRQLTPSTQPSGLISLLAFGGAMVASVSKDAVRPAPLTVRADRVLSAAR